MVPKYDCRLSYCAPLEKDKHFLLSPGNVAFAELSPRKQQLVGPPKDWLTRRKLSGHAAYE